MTFPTIPTVAAGRVLFANQANTTATRTFPDLSSLTKNAGDLLIAIICTYQSTTNPQFTSWGGGFTEFTDQGSSTTLGMSAAWKISDGTETGTFSVTQAATITGHASMCLLSIPGAHASTIPEAGTIANGTAAAANAASFNPTNWDVEDTLWIAVAGSGMTSGTGSWTGTGTTYPTNYTDGVDSATTDSSTVGQTEIAVAFRQLAAASEDIGTFGVDTSNARNSALVIAVRPAAAAYTLTADSGSISVSGTAAALRAARKVEAASGGVSVTGTAASLRAARRLEAASGGVNVTGTDATLTYTPGRMDYTLTANSGSISVSGTAASLLAARKLEAASGGVNVTGTDATLSYSQGSAAYTLAANSGSINVTGTAASARTGRKLVASSGAITVTGTAASLRTARKLGAATGSVNVIGTDATLSYSQGSAAYTLAANSGSIVVSGTAAGLQAARRLVANSDSITVTGTAASLRAAYRMGAASGASSVSGTAAALLRQLKLEAGAGGYVVNGTAAALTRGIVLPADSAAVAISGTAATLTYAGSGITNATPVAARLLYGATRKRLKTDDKNRQVRASAQRRETS